MKGTASQSASGLVALVSAVVGGNGLFLNGDELLIREFDIWRMAEAASRAMPPELGLIFCGGTDAEVYVGAVITRLARQIDAENCDQLTGALQVAIDSGKYDESNMAACLETYFRAAYLPRAVQRVALGAADRRGAMGTTPQSPNDGLDDEQRRRFSLGPRKLYTVETTLDPLIAWCILGLFEGMPTVRERFDAYDDVLMRHINHLEAKRVVKRGRHLRVLRGAMTSAAQIARDLAGRTPETVVREHTQSDVLRWLSRQADALARGLFDYVAHGREVYDGSLPPDVVAGLLGLLHAQAQEATRMHTALDDLFLDVAATARKGGAA